MEIIVKRHRSKAAMDQIRSILQVPEQGIVIGDLRNEMGRDMLRVVEQVINQRIKEDSYYLLIYAHHDRQYAKGDPLHRKVIKTTVMYSDVLPERFKIMGTICFHVDNRAGRVEREWILPLDIPRPEILMGDGVSKDVHDSVVGERIIH
jgi:hypothetical protein